MLIKFKAPDPRAGTVAQMDSRRGQNFIDSGTAVQLKEDGSDKEPIPVFTPTPDQATAAPKAKAKK